MALGDELQAGMSASVELDTTENSAAATLRLLPAKHNYLHSLGWHKN